MRTMESISVKDKVNEPWWTLEMNWYKYFQFNVLVDHFSLQIQGKMNYQVTNYFAF